MTRSRKTNRRCKRGGGLLATIRQAFSSQFAKSNAADNCRHSVDFFGWRRKACERRLANMNRSTSDPLHVPAFNLVTKSNSFINDTSDYDALMKRFHSLERPAKSPPPDNLMLERELHDPSLGEPATTEELTNKLKLINSKASGNLVQSTNSHIDANSFSEEDELSRRIMLLDRTKRNDGEHGERQLGTEEYADRLRRIEQELDLPRYHNPSSSASASTSANPVRYAEHPNDPNITFPGPERLANISSPIINSRGGLNKKTHNRLKNKKKYSPCTILRYCRRNSNRSGEPD